MELSKEQIRLLLHFQKGMAVNASEAARNVSKVYGDKIIAERTARKWYKIFDEEGDRLTDNPRSDRPREVDRQAVVNAIEENPLMTTRMLADDFDCGKTTIEEILHEAGKNAFSKL
jgi:histone-lysine N-methyltransferase SETMAR